MRTARYQRIDDLLRHQWRAGTADVMPPGSVHQDVKRVLELVVSADAPLAEAMGARPHAGR